jgi:hypothetical protein
MGAEGCSVDVEGSAVAEGRDVGAAPPEGVRDGAALCWLGSGVGAPVGALEGLPDVGAPVVGAPVGSLVGRPEGARLGTAVGRNEIGTDGEPAALGEAPAALGLAVLGLAVLGLAVPGLAVLGLAVLGLAVLGLALGLALLGLALGLALGLVVGLARGAAAAGRTRAPSASSTTP